MATVKTLFQHSTKPTFIENITLRPNGHILATNLLTPTVIALDPLTCESSIIATIPGGSHSLTGITALSPTSDKYVVAAGDYDLEKGPSLGSWSLHLLDLTASPAKVTLIAKTPNISLINGITTWDEHTILATDCTVAGKIFKVDVKTGEYSVAFDFEELTVPEGAAFPVSVNGIKIFTHGSQRYLYFTNSARGSLYRVAISSAADVSLQGAVEVVAGGISGPDDFCLTEDGTAYIAWIMGNRVVKVESVGGEVKTLAGDQNSFDVAGPTALVLDRERGVIYASTCGGIVAPIDDKTEPAKIVEIKLP